MKSQRNLNPWGVFLKIFLASHFMAFLARILPFKLAKVHLIFTICATCLTCRVEPVAQHVLCIPGKQVFELSL